MKELLNSVNQETTRLCQSETTQGGDHFSSRGDGIKAAKLSSCKSSTNKFKRALKNHQKITFGEIQNAMKPISGWNCSRVILGRPFDSLSLCALFWRGEHNESQFPELGEGSDEALNLSRVLQDVCQKAPRGPWYLADVNKYWLHLNFFHLGHSPMSRNP